jgi:hypothetical protein
MLTTLLAAGYVSVRNNTEEPCLVRNSDEWLLGKYPPFPCKIFPRDIFIAFYGNFRPCFQHISLRNIFQAIYHLEIIIRCHGTRLYNCVPEENITGCQQCK